MLEFIAKALKRGSDEEDRIKIDADINVVKGIIVLRSSPIMSQALLHRSIYGYDTALHITWESYWSNGSALEKLGDMLTFNLDHIFNFSINITPKVLSFVVIGVELVAAIGANIKQTSWIRLCCRCCQPYLLRITKFLIWIGLLAERVQMHADRAEKLNENPEESAQEAVKHVDVNVAARREESSPMLRDGKSGSSDVLRKASV